MEHFRQLEEIMIRSFKGVIISRIRNSFKIVLSKISIGNFYREFQYGISLGNLYMESLQGISIGNFYREFL